MVSAQSNDVALISAHERSFFLWLAFAFQNFSSDYFFALLDLRPYFFFFFFIEHCTAVYNLFCLVFFNEYSLAYAKRVIEGVTWRLTKTGWGKKTLIVRFDPASYIFLGLFLACSMVEVQCYKGLHFTLFNAGFFVKEQRRRVYYCVGRLWWYGVSFFLYAKSYLYHLGLVRYNAYVTGVFSGLCKPLLRAAVVSKNRLPERHRTKDFRCFIEEKFSIFLASCRFVFFKDKVKREARTKQRTQVSRYIITEAITSDGNIVSPGTIGSWVVREEDVVDSLFYIFSFWSQHQSLQALGNLHINYLHSEFFYEYCFYYYYYFLHCFIQASPKKYGFTYCWVKVWVALPFLGALWADVAKEFKGKFMKELTTRYLRFLFTSHEALDSNLLEAFWFPLEEGKDFFDWWRSFHYEIRFLDYNREAVRSTLHSFGGFWSNWEYDFDHMKALAGFMNAAPLLRFLLSRLFAFVEPLDVLPFSYPFFIFWKVTNFYIFNGLAPKEEALLFYFQRLHLDAFFFNRLRHCMFIFSMLVHSIRGSSQEDFFDYTEKPDAVTSGSFFPEGAAPAPGGNARLKLHVLFFFFLRDFFFKELFFSKLLALYLYIFSLGSSLQTLRSFFLDFSFCQMLQFRSFFSGLFFDRFAAPAAEEPIVFYSPTQHSSLRYYFRAITDGRERPSVIALRRARGFPKQASWFPWQRAFRGECVNVLYMDEPLIDMFNWEIALTGSRLPQENFVEGYVEEEYMGIFELRLSFYFMVFGK